MLISPRSIAFFEVTLVPSDRVLVRRNLVASEVYETGRHHLEEVCLSVMPTTPLERYETYTGTCSPLVKSAWALSVEWDILTEIRTSSHATQGIIDPKCLPSLHLLGIQFPFLLWRHVGCESESVNNMSKVMLIGIFEVWDL
jgi:hypothetical protein